MASSHIANHVDDEDKLRTQIGYAGQKREVTIINESGLYSLILSSKLPKAREFKHWVTNDVLPKIRQTEAYMTHDTMMQMMQMMQQPEQVVLLCRW